MICWNVCPDRKIPYFADEFLYFWPDFFHFSSAQALTWSRNLIRTMPPLSRFRKKESYQTRWPSTTKRWKSRIRYKWITIFTASSGNCKTSSGVRWCATIGRIGSNSSPTAAMSCRRSAITNWIRILAPTFRVSPKSIAKICISQNTWRTKSSWNCN